MLLKRKKIKMSRSDQITGKKPKKKTKVKTKRTASLRMDIRGVPEIISQFEELEKKIRYTPTIYHDDGTISPGRPIPPDYDDDD
tara:strand:- start:972 stop:1223 length:252 start_codon:yes stop_codon:yes gene_type:complete